MKQFICCVLALAIASIAVAQEHNYYVEAEQAFQRSEYAKAANLYKIAYAMTGRDTSAKQKLSGECAEAQKDARDQKNARNIEQAKVLFERLLEKNPNDAEAKDFISKYAQSAQAHGDVSKILEDAVSAYNSGYYDKALTLFSKINNNPTAQNNLGVMYEKGKGVSQDYSEAVRWYRKAAEQRYAYAQCNLGYMYEKGKGVSQDYSEAVGWYRKAAEQGFKLAQDRLKELGEEL